MKEWEAGTLGTDSGRGKEYNRVGMLEAFHVMQKYLFA